MLHCILAARQSNNGNQGETVDIELISSTEIALKQLHKPGFEISSSDPELHYGAIEMFVSSLAMCTFSVLAAYGERVEVGVDALSIGLKWTYGEKPHRIDQVDMDVRWPEIPESKLDVAMRSAATCTIHRTMTHSVEVETMIDR